MGIGLIRTLLALSVVLTHSCPICGYNVADGMIAVECFFIISGFYMALILNEKYVGPGSTWMFYSNRFLKLYPVYWLVLLLMVVIAAFIGRVLRGEGQFLSSVVAQARHAVVALSEDLLDRRQFAAFWTRRGVSREVQFCQRLVQPDHRLLGRQMAGADLPAHTPRLDAWDRVAVLLHGRDSRPAKAGEAPCVGGSELVAPRGLRAGGLLQHVGLSVLSIAIGLLLCGRLCVHDLPRA